MIFRQLFEPVSCTYTYLLASRRGGEALILDPVLEKVDRYLQLIRELDLKLVKAVDTHLHADHITGLGALRDQTQCITVMGEQSGVDVVSMRVADGDMLRVEGMALEVMHTPGHTDDSYSFRWRKCTRVQTISDLRTRSGIAAGAHSRRPRSWRSERDSCRSSTPSPRCGRMRHADVELSRAGSEGSRRQRAGEMRPRDCRTGRPEPESGVLQIRPDGWRLRLR